MSVTQYTLPPIYNRPVGVINSYLLFTQDFAPPTIPPVLRILNIGELIERIDVENGSTELENIDITFAEDYSTYPEGFWYKLIIENPSINFDVMLTLVNDANEEYYFRGTICRQNSSIPEMFLDNVNNPTKWVRGMKLQFTSLITYLQNVEIGDVCSLVATKFVSMVDTDFAGTPTYNFAKLRTIFASIYSIAFNSTYDESLILNNGDFQVTNPGAISPYWMDWIEGYIISNWFYAANLPPLNAPNTYFSSYSTGWDLLKNLCAQFGVIPRYWYGNSSMYIDPVAANNKHHLTFNSRGRSGSLITPCGNILGSTIVPVSTKRVSRLQVTSLNANDPAWYYDGTLHLYSPEDWRQFDKTISTDFVTLQTAPYVALFQPLDSGHCYTANTIRYWNYSTGSYSTIGSFSEALASYLFYRYNFAGRIEINRTYGSILANNGLTNSQLWMQNLNQHSINDGITTRSFYSTEIHKDILNNTTQVCWVQQ
jgi:hypothetical protein